MPALAGSGARAGKRAATRAGYLPPGGFSLPPSLAQVPLATYFHSSGALSFLAWPAQACVAVPQSFWPALAMP